MSEHSIDKRLDKRIAVRLEAYIFSGSKTYTGFIENASENGFEFLVVSSIKAAKSFHPEKVVGLYFQIPSGKTLHLYCEVKWYLENSYDRSVSLGMKIINTPQEYKEFIKTLDIVSVN